MASTSKSKQDYNDYHYSGLEVVDDRGHNAPELDLRHQTEKEAVYAKEAPNAEHTHETAPKPSKRRLCGMRRPVALTVFGIIAVVVIGAIVGGAVGGSQSSSNKRYVPITLSQTSNLIIQQRFVFS